MAGRNLFLDQTPQLDEQGNPLYAPAVSFFGGVPQSRARATPRNWMAGPADFLTGVQEKAKQWQSEPINFTPMVAGIPQVFQKPVVGAATNFLLAGAPEFLDRMSYDNESAFRGSGMTTELDTGAVDLAALAPFGTAMKGAAALKGVALAGMAGRKMLTNSSEHIAALAAQGD